MPPFDSILSPLFDPGIENAQTALDRALSASPKQQRRWGSWPGLGSRLAVAQTLDVVLRLLARCAGSRDARLRDVLGNALQGLVLRGGSMEAEPHAVAYHRGLKEAGHPLGWLPLHRSDLEEHLPLAHYGNDGGSGYSMGAPGGAPAQPTAEPRVFKPEDLEPAVIDRMRLAVAGWERGSNGRSDVGLYRLVSGAADLELSPAEVGNLKLDWLPPEPPRLWCLDARAPLEALFGAAANGGAYSAGLGDGEGRRQAWCSAGALAGAAEGAAFAKVEDQVRGTRWYTPGAPQPWFAGVAWDVSLLALRPDGTLATLAATDTD